VRVRRAVAADAGLLAELNSVVQRLHHDNEPDRFKPPDAAGFEPMVREWLRQPNVQAFIAEDATERPIGYLLAVVHERPGNPLVRGGRFVELDQIAVLPEYRQSGVGHALAQCVFAYAHEVGATEIELTTWDFNGTARAFFANLGFRTRHVRMAAPVTHT
jgi:GNAT superfamily N-acetyltransferase